MNNIQILTGTVEAVEDTFINVKLHNNNQIVKCVKISPINLDEREQKPNIKTGTEVIGLLVGVVPIILGSMAQGVDKVTDEIYRIENLKTWVLTDEFEVKKTESGGEIDYTDILTKKLHVNNGTHELMALIDELHQTINGLIDTIKGIQVLGNLGVPATLMPPSMTALDGDKGKFDALNGKFNTFKK